MSDVPEVPLTEVPPDAVLLDVREDNEWQAGHARSAVHLPMSALADRLDEVPDGEPLYVICRTGGRSARVTQYLNTNGWNAVNVAGGMSSWAVNGGELVSEDGRKPEVL